MDRTSVLGQIRIFGGKEGSSTEEHTGNGEHTAAMNTSSNNAMPQDEIEQNESGESHASLGSIPSAREMMSGLNRARKFSGKVVNSERVQWFIVILIAINGIMLGIGTFDFVSDNESVKNAFDIVDKIFLVIFTIELGLQFLYHGWRLFLDGWLVFDLVVITMSWAFESLQIVRAFRIFRALRLITRIKVMKNLILAIFGVMPRIAAISFLLFLIMYIFTVMFTVLFSDLYTDFFSDWNYFGRLDLTFFTLFQLMTLDDWASIARQTIDAYTYAWLPILAYLIITGFIVVNLIIAVICDAIAELNDDQIAKIHGTYESEREVEVDDHPARPRRGSRKAFIEAKPVEPNSETEQRGSKQNKRRSSMSATSESEIVDNGEASSSISFAANIVSNADSSDACMNDQIVSLSEQVEALARIQEETQAAMNQLAMFLAEKRKKG